MISFLDINKINKSYEAVFHEKLQKVMDNGWYILGSEVKTFEENFANYCNKKYCVGVGNGLDAIVIAFKAYIELGILQKGDEIIVPANTYIASILGIIQADLVPVLVEPKWGTYNINPASIEEKITSKTKGILVVHLYGQLAEMDKINTIAVKNNLIVVEDAAQSHGAISNLKPKIFDLKSCVTYSFYPGKNLGALGDGGAVVTDDEQLANVIKSLSNYGSQAKYYNDYKGFNSRLDELQAAFLNCKLPHLDQDNEKRRDIAKRYSTEIKNDKIILPFWDGSKNHVFHLFVIRTENRSGLQAYLLENKIKTLIHYPVAPHQQKALVEYRYLSFPITEKIQEEVLSLPMSPVMTDAEVHYVIAILNKY
jgi:dTDP-4-amino-4,6-dideoxygalactose transaminase